MGNTLRRMILTETGLALLFTVVTILNADGSVDMARAIAGFLICLRAVVALTRVVVKKLARHIRRSRQAMAVSLAQG